MASDVMAAYFTDTAPAENVLVYDDQPERRRRAFLAVIAALKTAGFYVWAEARAPLTTKMLLSVEKARAQAARRAVVLDNVDSVSGPLMRRLLMRNADVTVVLCSGSKNVRGDCRLGRMWLAREARWVERGPAKCGAEIVLDDAVGSGGALAPLPEVASAYSAWRIVSWLRGNEWARLK